MVPSQHTRDSAPWQLSTSLWTSTSTKSRKFCSLIIIASTTDHFKSYFIEQVGLAAASFGVATADVEVVGTALMSLFGYRCAPPVTVIPAQGPQLDSICVAENCPIAPNATCSSYPTVMHPVAAMPNNTYMGNGTSSNGSVSTATSSMNPAMYTGSANAASGLAVEAAMGFLGVAAIALAL